MNHREVVYYESIKREINKKLIFDSRCDGRLKSKTEGCTRLTTLCGARNRNTYKDIDEVNKREVSECDG